MMNKPTKIEDLEPPFEVIGEAGWAERLRRLLDDYDVPATNPAEGAKLGAAAARLSIDLPPDLCLFYAEVGAVDLDGFSLLPVEQFQPANVRGRVAVEIGAFVDQPILWDPVNQQYWCRSHDPDRLTGGVASFSDLIRAAVIDLCWGYYGWPDRELEALAREARATYVGTPWFE